MTLIISAASTIVDGLFEDESITNDFLMSSSETDPLLPQGNSAPEITGFGFSKLVRVQKRTRSEVIDQVEDIENKHEERATQTDGGLSPLRVIITLFTIVVGLALIITLLFPGTWDTLRHPPKDDERSTIKARVDKILASTPLVGPEYLKTNTNQQIET